MSARITMSAFAPTLAEQCAEQGLVATGTNVEMSERLAQAITLCHVRGVLTDSETDRARKRVITQMRLRQVRPAIDRALPSTTKDAEVSQ